MRKSNLYEPDRSALEGAKLVCCSFSLSSLYFGILAAAPGAFPLPMDSYILSSGAFPLPMDSFLWSPESGGFPLAFFPLFQESRRLMSEGGQGRADFTENRK